MRKILNAFGNLGVEHGLPIMCAAALLVFIVCFHWLNGAKAAAPSPQPLVPGPAPQATDSVQPRPTGIIFDTPAITIAGAAATSNATPTTTAREAQIEWLFGTVTGSYGTCTVQALTSFDGTNFFTLGGAASVTVATGEFNAWTIIEQLGTTSVTTSSVSANTTAGSVAALGFGQLTKFTFACSGGYGTSAPVSVSVIYR
jgi:hypothetical protein